MKTIATIPLLLLAACASPQIAKPVPLVTDYNGHMVKVQWHQFHLGASYQASPAYATAVETCARDGFSDAIYQGVRVVAYDGIHTFICA